jgi:hypothetical protein
VEALLQLYPNSRNLKHVLGERVPFSTLSYKDFAYRLEPTIFGLSSQNHKTLDSGFSLTVTHFHQRGKIVETHVCEKPRDPSCVSCAPVPVSRLWLRHGVPKGPQKIGHF